MEHATQHAEAGSSSPSAFRANIDDRQVDFAHPEPEGRKVLAGAGCDPADDFVLIELELHGTRSIGLDERVDLRGPHEKAFRTFKSDRIYCFTVDSRGYEWGVAVIPEPELRQIAHVSDDEVLVIEYPHGKEVVFGPDGKLDLGGPHTEHLRTKKRLITVFYDNEPKPIPAGVYTTEELKKLFEVPPGYLLNVVNEHGQLEPLKPEQRLHVREGMKFFSQAPGGGSA